MVWSTFGCGALALKLQSLHVGYTIYACFNSYPSWSWHIALTSAIYLYAILKKFTFLKNLKCQTILHVVQGFILKNINILYEIIENKSLMLHVHIHFPYNVGKYFDENSFFFKVQRHLSEGCFLEGKCLLPKSGTIKLKTTPIFAHQLYRSPKTVVCTTYNCLEITKMCTSKLH